MSIKSYFDEFNRRYNQPQIQSVTVGFSGIDPTPKATYITDPSGSGSGSGGVSGSGSGGAVIINGGSNQYGVMEDDDFNSMMDDVFGN